MKTKDETISEHLKAIEERKKIWAEREKADKVANKIVNDIKKKTSTIIKHFESNADYDKRMIQSCVFSGPRDPRIKKYESKFEDDLEDLGQSAGKLIKDTFDFYCDIIDAATPRTKISIIEATEEIIDYVDGSEIVCNNNGKKLKYSWDIGTRKIINEFKRDIVALKKQKVVFEKNEKKQKAEDRIFEETQKYGVDEKDLEKHKAYLLAKKIMRNAKHYTEYKEAGSMFAQLDNYLDSMELKKKCIDIAKKLKPIQEIEDKVERIEERISNKKTSIKSLRCKLNNSNRKKNKLEKELLEQKDYLERYKNEYKIKVEDLEEKIKEKTTEITNYENKIQDTNSEIEKLGFFKRKEKKSLRSQILDIESKISSLKSDLEKHNTKKQKQKNDYENELKELNKEIREIKDNLDKETKKNFEDDINNEKEKLDKAVEEKESLLKELTNLKKENTTIDSELQLDEDDYEEDIDLDEDDYEKDKNMKDNNDEDTEKDKAPSYLSDKNPEINFIREEIVSILEMFGTLSIKGMMEKSRKLSDYPIQKIAYQANYLTGYGVVVKIADKKTSLFRFSGDRDFFEDKDKTELKEQIGRPNNNSEENIAIRKEIVSLIKKYKILSVKEMMEKSKKLTDYSNQKVSYQAHYMVGTGELDKVADIKESKFCISGDKEFFEDKNKTKLKEQAKKPPNTYEENIAIRKEILSVLEKYPSLSIYEIMERSRFLYDLSSQKVSYQANYLVGYGEIEKMIEGTETKFKLR